MKKDLAKLIQKMAQDSLADPPGVHSDAPAKPVNEYKHPHDKEVVGPLNQGRSTSSFKVIKDMQNALVNLAKNVTTNNIDTKEDKDNSTTSTLVRVIRDEASRLDVAEKENFADGSWGPITNTALHNAVVLATSLISLSSQLPSLVYDFSQKDLEAYKSLIGNDPTEFTIAEKLHNAPEITKLLNQLNSLYTELKDQMKASETFQPYKTNDAEISDKRLSELNAKFNNMTVTVGTNPPAPISVHDLVSMDSFNAWKKKNLPNADTYQILVALKKNIFNQEGRTPTVQDLNNRSPEEIKPYNPNDPNDPGNKEAL